MRARAASNCENGVARGSRVLKWLLKVCKLDIQGSMASQTRNDGSAGKTAYIRTTFPSLSARGNDVPKDKISTRHAFHF